MKFIKLHAVYPKAHNKRGSLDDMTMREVNIRPENVVEVSPAIDEDGCPGAATLIIRDGGIHMFVTEATDEVLEAIKQCQLS